MCVHKEKTHLFRVQRVLILLTECLKDLQAEIKMSENVKNLFDVAAEFTAKMIYERLKTLSKITQKVTAFCESFTYDVHNLVGGRGLRFRDSFIQRKFSCLNILWQGGGG
jgi:hypothetical protein